jgi:heme-degrading monooxygenase HmoA
MSQEPAAAPASTPPPPYYAVIFTSIRTPADAPGYAVTADHMVELARQQPGFLGVDSARGADGLGITVSYCSIEEAIRACREHAEHQLAQASGREKWYAQFQLRVARVERAYGLDVERRRP